MAHTRPKSPFDLPELREIIRAYLTKNDAIACSRVCRTWSSYFRDIVWSTVDFSKFNQAQMTCLAIVTHGRHIRAVKNLQSSSQIDLLMWNQQQFNLSSLSVTLAAELSYQTDLYDFLRLVRCTLTELDLAASTAAKINVPVDVFLPRGPSRLTKVSLRGLQLTRLSLTELLQGCPDLQDLSLYNIYIPSRNLTIDRTYKHTSLRYLSAPFEEFVTTGNGLSFLPPSPLLSLFPGLERWNVWTNDSLDHSRLREHSQTIRRSCPRLNQVQLTMGSIVAVKDFVAHVFDEIETLAFVHQALSTEFVIAILGHSKTLKHIEYLPLTGTWFYDLIDPPQLHDHYRNLGWTIESILRHCSQLESFCFPHYEAEMDDIEKGGWECYGLKELRIRIAGLDTAEKIERAIELWLDGRRFHRRIEKTGHPASPPAEYLRIGRTLESRVAAHLIKFNELRTVWLGTKVWRV
ncbi:hypothetical protein BGZ68_006924 [Mortierella alpina]|nr:hypothetical protein BGZ68_006924 [Mortierella alpina]